MIKLIVLSSVALVLCLTGCAATQKNIFDQTSLNSVSMYSDIVDNIPKLGKPTEKFLGDRMLVERTGQFKECVKPKFSMQGDTMGTYAKIISGELICKKSALSKNFEPTYINTTWNSGKNEGSYPVIFSRKSDGTVKACVAASGMTIGCKDGIKDSDLSYGPAFVNANNSFQRGIEYAGKSGDVLKFTYSEFRDGMARDAFTRDFQVDISESNVAAYKGAIIEIHKASNTSINYTINRYFQ